jgi:hypothetical protein
MMISTIPHKNKANSLRIKVSFVTSFYKIEIKRHVTIAMTLYEYSNLSSILIGVLMQQGS